MTATERVRRWRLANPEKYKTQWTIQNKRETARKARRRYKKKPAVILEQREQNRIRMHSEPAKSTTRKSKGLPEPTRPYPDACENCGGPPTGKKKKDGSPPSFHNDHCHVTMRFRGWLCGKCNQGLGLLGDNRLGLAKADAYLLRFEHASKVGL